MRIFCENFIKKFKGKIGQMRNRSCSLALISFLYKVEHKIGRLRKFNHAREIKFNFFHRLDYLYETWHTCLSCSWLENVASDVLIFA